MNIVLVKDGLGNLRPATSLDIEKIGSIRVGELMRATIRQPRNLQLHRKFMALWHYVFEHQERYRTFEDLLCEVKIRLGHYREHIGIDGVIHFVPKSIAFDDCDDLTFRSLYERSVDLAISDFLPLFSREDIEEGEREILRFT